MSLGYKAHDLKFVFVFIERVIKDSCKLVVCCHPQFLSVSHCCTELLGTVSYQLFFTSRNIANSFHPMNSALNSLVSFNSFMDAEITVWQFNRLKLCSSNLGWVIIKLISCLYVGINRYGRKCLPCV